MAFDSPPKLRRSVAVAVAAPIETVVDAHLHHLDVAVPHKESISGDPRSQGRDPCLVTTPRDSCDGASVVIIRGPIELGSNSKNSVPALPVVPELASPDEHAVVVSAAEAAQEEGVGHAGVSPGPAN